MYTDLHPSRYMPVGLYQEVSFHGYHGKDIFDEIFKIFGSSGSVCLYLTINTYKLYLNYPYLNKKVQDNSRINWVFQLSLERAYVTHQAHVWSNKLERAYVTHQAHVWSNKAVCGGQRRVRANKQRRKKLLPRSHWNPTVLCKMSQRINARSTWIIGNTTSQPNPKHNDEGQAAIRLCCNAPQCNSNIQRKRHGTSRAQQCIISIWKQCAMQGWRTFLHVKRHQHATQQWRSDEDITMNQGSTILSGWSRSRSTIHQLRRSSTCKTRLRIPGTQTTTHTYANRKYDGIRSCQSKRDEKIKINGYEIPLATVQNQSGTIRTLLEGR